MKDKMKKTKIICTIGPASEDPKMLKKLVLAGMNVMRCNFSHGDYEEHGKKMQTMRDVNAELGTNCAILLDTKGPEIRTGDFEGGFTEFKKGQVSTICVEDIVGTADRFTITYKDLYKDVKPGGFILVNDGQVELLVDHVEGTDIVCVCANDGKVKNKRGINVPGIELGFDFISEKDREDIKYACDKDGDYLAISFVNSADDVNQVRELCKEFGKPNMPIISKVETQYAMDNLDEIVEASDYIMVARGDLGIETGVENLPLYQQMMIDKCHANGKGVIMATQMMYSMKTNIRPTNAEVTDVANAVLAGCDAIMTSDETTIGQYPVETIQTMTSICENVERITKYN